MTGAQIAEERLEIRVQADVVVAQTRVRSMAAAMGFPRQAQWEIATALSEAGTNVIKHAGGGVVFLRDRPGPPRHLEFEAVDQGGGIGDLMLATRDGFSEGTDLTLPGPVVPHRGLGLGLGAIQRLMDRLEIRSNDHGTSVRAQKDLREPPPWPPGRSISGRGSWPCLR